MLSSTVCRSGSIHCSEAHTRRAETVTERTLSDFYLLLPFMLHFEAANRTADARIGRHPQSVRHVKYPLKKGQPVQYDK